MSKMSRSSSPTEIREREPLPSPPWVCAILRREACVFLANAGVPITPPQHGGGMEGSPKICLQNAQTRTWLASSSARDCALQKGDAAAHNENQKLVLVSLPEPGTFALRNRWGHYLRADMNDGGFMNMMTVKRVDFSAQPKVDIWEVFRIAPHPTFPAAITLFSAHGYFVGHHNGNPTNRAASAGDAEAWLPHIAF